MEVIKITQEYYPLLKKYCQECKKLGWLNNSSLDDLRVDYIQEHGGCYFGIIENDELVSIAGCHKFIELNLDGWRIFYRSATLPGKAKNNGLHRGTGARGRLYIDAFIEYCNNEDMYFTTNIENSNWSGITRYHDHMLKESSLSDSYVEFCDTIELYGVQQAVWILNNEKYYQRTRKHHV